MFIKILGNSFHFLSKKELKQVSIIDKYLHNLILKVKTNIDDDNKFILSLKLKNVLEINQKLILLIMKIR
jgi:hypothetical protein